VGVRKALDENINDKLDKIYLGFALRNEVANLSNGAHLLSRVRFLLQKPQTHFE